MTFSCRDATLRECELAGDLHWEVEQIFHHQVILISKGETEDLVLWVVSKHDFHFMGACR